MDHARFTLALPNEPELLDRLITAVAVQDDPPITVGRSATAVLAFECATWDGMLRSRVVLPSRRRSVPTGSRSRGRWARSAGAGSLRERARRATADGRRADDPLRACWRTLGSRAVYGARVRAMPDQLLDRILAEI